MPHDQSSAEAPPTTTRRRRRPPELPKEARTAKPERVTMDLGELQPADYNPRDITTEALDGLGRSVSEFGYVQDLVWNRRTGRLVAGHQRLKVLREQGYTSAEVTVVDLDEDHERALNITLNNPLIAGTFTDDVAGLVDEIRKGSAVVDATVDQLRLSDLVDDVLRASRRANSFHQPPDPEQRQRLVRDFGAPPFSVLDARQGYWMQRKRAWLATGIQSSLGREQLGSTSAAGAIQKGNTESGGSVFDPVLCELAYRWFAPPGAQVLDPFAGGSVRGVVAQALGCRYTGVDLSEQQVEANRAQLPGLVKPELVEAGHGIQAVAAHPAPDPLCVVELHDGAWVKRCDMAVGGLGQKALSMLAELAAQPQRPTGLVTYGSRRSVQIMVVAGVAKQEGLSLAVYVPGAKEATEEVEAAKAAGATVEQVKPGYSSVVHARARDAADQGGGGLLLEGGIPTEASVDAIARECGNLPAATRRVVVCAGSGVTAAGVLRGTAGTDIQVVAVRVGQEIDDVLQRFASEHLERLRVLDAGVPYDQPLDGANLGTVPLDPYYEAKCLEALGQDEMNPTDVLWVSGHRDAVKEALTKGRKEHSGRRQRLEVTVGADNRLLRDAVTIYNATSAKPLMRDWVNVAPSLQAFLEHVYGSLGAELQVLTVADEDPIAEAVDNGTMWVSFSGGKDGMAAALRAREQGYQPVLYHLSGMNKSFPDEVKYARAAAEAAGMPLVVDEIKLSRGEGAFIDVPTKNQIIGACMVARMLEHGGAHWAMGMHTIDTVEVSHPEINWSDTTTSASLWAEYLAQRVPGLQYHTLLNGQIESLALVAKHGMLDYIHGCVSPHRFAGQYRERNLAKFGDSLLPGRCGSCYKCLTEYIMLVGLGAVPRNEAMYSHAKDYLARAAKGERPVEWHGDPEHWFVGRHQDIVQQYVGIDWPGAPLQDPAHPPVPHDPPVPFQEVPAAPVELPSNEPQWLVGDASQLDQVLPADFEADLVFSCPPYHDLEVYSDNPADLSTMGWPAFLKVYRKAIAQAVARLRPNRFAVWVVGEVRGSDGMYRGLVPETIRAFQDAGAQLYNEAVYLTPLGSVPVRSTTPFRKSRKLAKVHQNVLVFYKGDAEQIATEYPPTT